MDKAMDAWEWRRKVRRISAELQTLTGATPHQVILSALEQRLAQLKGPATPNERVEQALAELRASTPWRTIERRAPSPAERDRALGYGREGV